MQKASVSAYRVAYPRSLGFRVQGGCIWGSIGVFVVIMETISQTPTDLGLRAWGRH